MLSNIYGEFLYELGVVNEGKKGTVNWYKSGVKYDNYIKGLYIIDRSLWENNILPN